jgi:predicted porin
MKKLALATIIGAAFAAPAQAVTVMAEDGWTLGVSGSVNQFVVNTNNDNGDDVNEVRDGLLPAFLNFDMKAPTMNGLDIAAHISISPSTNGSSYVDGGNFEQREVYFTVDGSFGQIMLGKGLGLYSANNILLDQTLYGVGATGLSAAGDQNTGVTSLGRIGYGYDYANWRSQIRWTSVDMNGFKVALAVVDGDEYLQAKGTGFEKDSRFEASASYASAFDGGSFKLWLDGMTQKVRFSDAVGDERSDAYTVGGQLVLGGFEAVAAYYDGEGQGIGGLGLGAFDTDGSAREGDGYYAQLGYRFGGQTFVAASYGESTLDRDNTRVVSDGSFGDLDSNSMATIGIYHDVTANLKLVAEYSQMETEYYNQSSDDEVDVFSLGGFISW